MASAGADLRIDRLTRTPVVAVRGGRPSRLDRPPGACPHCDETASADVRSIRDRSTPLPDGRTETVVHSPEHRASLGSIGPKQVRQVVDVWTERTLALAARDDVAYVLIFENRDVDIDVHAHSDIYGFREVPPLPLRELTAGQCTLCEPPPEHLVVRREGAFIAWCPNASVYPYEVRIAPVEHRFGFAALDESARDDCASLLADVLERLDRSFPEAVPYALWWHQRPTDRGEWPLAHLHAHINPRLSSVGVDEMGSGVAFNPVPPEEAASRLRSA